MAERVHAAPLPDEPPALSPTTDPLGIDSRGEELPPSDDPMLPLGQPANETDGIFVFHTDT